MKSSAIRNQETRYLKKFFLSTTCMVKYLTGSNTQSHNSVLTVAAVIQNSLGTGYSTEEVFLQDFLVILKLHYWGVNPHLHVLDKLFYMN